VSGIFALELYLYVNCGHHFVLQKGSFLKMKQIFRKEKSEMEQKVKTIC
jgi:hypothetical protein